MKHNYPADASPDRANEPPSDALSAEALNAAPATAALEHLFGYRIAQASIPFRQIFRANIGRKFELGMVEFSILALVARNPGLAPKTLSQTLSVPASNLSSLLVRLETRGLISRQRGRADRRTQEIHLTATGSKLAEQALTISRTMEAPVLRRLDDDERATLLRLLAKITGTARPGG